MIVAAITFLAAFAFIVGLLVAGRGNAGGRSLSVPLLVLLVAGVVLAVGRL